eukprot:662254-Prorocentrum_lima.AAC.1
MHVGHEAVVVLHGFAQLQRQFRRGASGAPRDISKHGVEPLLHPLDAAFQVLDALCQQSVSAIREGCGRLLFSKSDRGTKLLRYVPLEFWE